MLCDENVVACKNCFNADVLKLESCHRDQHAFVAYLFYTVSQKKVHPFNFCDNFPNCKPIQIIFGRNIADEIWNKLTCNSFDIYSLCVCVTSLHRKMTPIFSQFQNVKILVSHIGQFLR